MKRVLGLALVASAAFATVPAHAVDPLPKPTVTIRNDENGVGVGTAIPGQPLFGARYTYATGELCVGFSYQVPFCVRVVS
jgi:hypothetical protein